MTGTDRQGEWERSLPRLDGAALHGPAADWALETAGSHSEASIVGFLVCAIVGFGCAVGRVVYVAPGITHHYSNENALLVGPSGTGRKGEAMELGLLPVRAADTGFAQERIMRGFGSGEALVEAVQDELRETIGGEEKVLAPAAADKRLLIHEAEFANVITVAERRDSSLSGNLRAAWDGAQLANRTKGRKIVANEAHISVVAGITPTELVRRMFPRRSHERFRQPVSPCRCVPLGDPAQPTVDFARCSCEACNAVRAGAEPLGETDGRPLHTIAGS